MRIYLDIETLPASSPEVVEQLAATIKPPATFKKPESIAEWMRDNKDAALADLVAKTSFNGLLGRIACICFAIEDCDPLSVADDDEDAMLAKFREAIQDATSVAANGRDVYVPATIIGHNLIGFDLPFLKHRSIINRIKPAPQIVKAMEAKPWDACIGDTMLMWSADRERRASMDALCKAFGIKGKDGFDGSMVASTWPVDRQKVIDYCMDDVRRTREIYKRITFSE